MWFRGGTPGNITQVEVYQDNNKAFEATLAQLIETYGEYGFQFGQPNFYNQTVANTAGVPRTLLGYFNPPATFDAAFIADPDQRWWKALKCVNSLNVRVFSNVAQTLTVVMETMPGSYAS
jgi:hypothetical protein